MSGLSKDTAVAVIGAGAMGAGIAQIAAAAGHQVFLYDTRIEAAEKAVAGIQRTFNMLAEKGKMSFDLAQASAQRLHVATELAQLKDVGLAVEAIVENLSVKQAVFADLEAVVADDCILASNTSSISITALAARLRLPGRFVGMHFFNPVPLMALVEIIRGLATDEAVAETLYATSLAWGKHPVHAKSTPGFIVNRVARPYYAEALRLLNEQAAEPATIDLIMREAGGFRMGPFELMDMIGHDVNFAVTNTVYQAYFNDPRFTPSLLQQELVSAGFLGKKTGRGFYQYGAGVTPPAGNSEVLLAMADDVVITSADPLAQALQQRLTQTGIKVTEALKDGIDTPLLVCGGAHVYLTDGRTATLRADQNQVANTILLDLAFDALTSKRLVLAVADQCDIAAYQAVVGTLQTAGYAVTRVDDAAGMVVMRTVAMLANEAADAVNQGVCDVAAVDAAMQKGVNYPRGPLKWADTAGIAHIVTVLQNMADWYGEDRYRISPLLQRKKINGRKFYD
ncbi:3-hydroxyacyl-CoA dehydrogenase PaaH [Undibacterium sp. SXout7W]|uniref:3-hydroxyacyl-CoA dehydrogenase PaaH n=1 Tax=Undibacterium sp. SXout7W TaxID=3413049 RepID=UPI003BEF8211